jgi:predicted nucleotidyltransferase
MELGGVQGGKSMNVAQPIKSVVPTVDGPVYAALAGTTSPLTLTQVHRLAGHSIERVRLVLRRMVVAGVIIEVPGGYVLNRDHLAAAAIEVLATLHGQLMDRIRDKVVDWVGEVDLVGMYGSAARRDGDEHSDIDLLVVSESADLDDFTSELSEAVHRWTGNNTQVVGLRPSDLKQLRRTHEPIVAEWQKDLIVVCGDRRALTAA